MRCGAGHQRHHRVECHPVPGREEFPEVQHPATAWTSLAVHSAHRIHDVEYRDGNRLVDVDQQLGKAGCGRGLAMQSGFVVAGDDAEQVLNCSGEDSETVSLEYREVQDEVALEQGAGDRYTSDEPGFERQDCRGPVLPAEAVFAGRGHSG